jgi:hypothetical protein
MPTRRFEQIALTQLFLSGCAIVFGACVLIARAQAQYVPPPAPPPCFQSLHSLYGAATELQTHHADNTKHRSRICRYLANE